MPVVEHSLVEHSYTCLDWSDLDRLAILANYRRGRWLSSGT